MVKAELTINGPKGQTHATLEVDEDGTIYPWAAEAALARALNLYHKLEEPKKEE